MSSFGEANLEISNPEELHMGDHHHLRLVSEVRDDLNAIFGPRYMRNRHPIGLPACAEEIIENFFRDLCTRFGVTWTHLEDDDQEVSFTWATVTVVSK